MATFPFVRGTSIRRCLFVVCIFSIGFFIACSRPTGVVEGRVLDQAGRPVFGARVEIEDSSLPVDSQGYFLFESLPAGAVILEARAPAYASMVRRVDVSAGSRRGVELNLYPEQARVLSNLNKKNHLRFARMDIEIPPVSIVDEDGQPVSSARIQVARPDLRANPDAMPGGYTGITTADETVRLESLGVVSIRLESEAGKELQIREGRVLTVRMPLEGAWSEATVPLWSLNESTGRWMEEGEGRVYTKNGKKWVEAGLPHLSWWNIDAPWYDKTTVLVKSFRDSEGNARPAWSLEAHGLSYNGVSSGRPAEAGVCVEVKLNSRVKLQGRLFLGARSYEVSRVIRTPARPSSCESPETGLIIDELVIERPPGRCVRGRFNAAEDFPAKFSWYQVDGGRDYFGGHGAKGTDGDFCLNSIPEGETIIFNLTRLDGEFRVHGNRLKLPRRIDAPPAGCSARPADCLDLGVIELKKQKMRFPGRCKDTETIVLKGGRSLRGCIAAEIGNRLIVKSPAGDFEIPKDAVVEIYFEAGTGPGSRMSRDPAS